ncbi:MAG: cell division protein FtsZ [Candidatus Binatia bacterium]|nr:MAG: cell division protein FtsZ [Candidatus Binatia bacterium]
MRGMDGETSDRAEALRAKIRVIGVGGAGGNAVNTMVEKSLQGVELIAANTDAQDLRANLAPVKIQLGEKVTRGLGAGGNPEIGREAAEESKDLIRSALEGSDMVFIAAGMGGGTGTGAAPVVAQIARELGALTVAVVTKPFAFEAQVRSKRAEEGIRALRDVVDTYMVIPNENLASIVDKALFVLDAFRQIDEVLYQAVRAVADLVTVPGFINLDFADVRALMANRGLALMGFASAAGEDRAVRAAQAAISSPLLEGVSIQSARAVLMNISGGRTMAIGEVMAAANLVRQHVHDDAEVIFGAVIDEYMADEFRVTVLATGFSAEASQASPKPVVVERAAAAANGREHAPRSAVTPWEARSVPWEARPRVFRGTIEDSEDGPRLHLAAKAAKGSAPAQAESKHSPDDGYYELGEDHIDENDTSIPAFLRRKRG